MNPDPSQAKVIFLEAVEKHDPAQWPAFLDQACAGQPELRRRVQELLQAHGEAGTDQYRARAEEAALRVVSGSVKQPGNVIGPYQLMQVIGEGGMGTVYLARQTEPVKRLLALKVIKAGMDSRQVSARFEAERQALALMDHPNIARVFDAGTTDSGWPYFVMEFVQGVPLTKYCDEHRLTPRERLDLFIPVCQAIQHAHQKGIIHRDVKPSNVLVASYDGKPVPKVIDFGVAKATQQQLTEHTLVTGFGAVVGTLEYMSPEQAELNQLDIDTRSDIYSLGVLLYELLTGSTPLDRKRLKEGAMLEVLRLIREEEPPRPSTRLSTTEQKPAVAANRGLEPKKLSGQVRGELDRIVMKALEKDRRRRYQTANGLAMDVQRYLADEPVQACPPSSAYRFRKFARRNKSALTMAALLLLVLVSLAGSIGWVTRDRSARRAALRQEATLALEEGRHRQKQGRRSEALASGRRAEALLATAAGNEDLRQRVRELLADLQMVLNVEEARSWSTEGLVNLEKENEGYERAFREYGIDVDALDVEVAAERIRACTIRHELTAVLDAWSYVRERLKKDGKDGTRLLEIARKADPDPWRNRLREAWEQHDRQALVELADSEEMAARPVPTVGLLGDGLMQVGAWEEGVAFLGKVRRRHPDDFWITYNLGYCLTRLQPPQWDEAIRYYTAAVALRPENVMARHNLGSALHSKGRPDEAIVEFQEVIRLKKDYPPAHSNLGNALQARDRLDEAIAEFQEAIRLKEDYAMAHNNLGFVLYRKGQLEEAITELKEAIRLDRTFVLAHNNLVNALVRQGDLHGASATLQELGNVLRDKGDLPGANAAFQRAIALKPDQATAHVRLGNALYDKGDLPGAIAEYRRAIALKDDHAEAHYSLGNALRASGDLPGARAAYQKAIACQPNFPEAHCNLGHVLREQGEFRKALDELRRGHELGSRNPRWHYPSAQWVRQCERLVELDGRLPDLLAGKAAPASAGERVELAELCAVKHLSRAAARFYEEAFAAQPNLLAGHRYSAACAAALAGCGLGSAADKLEVPERQRLRAQALGWLRDDLAAWAARLQKEPGKTGTAVLQQMRRWQRDSDLAGVRGAEALARLPEAEIAPWQKLWHEVEQLRNTAASVAAEPPAGGKELPFEQIGPAQIRAALAAGPEGRINGSNNRENQIPPGSVVVYQTDEKRYGKFKVLEYGSNLAIRWVTYAPDGSVFNSGDRLVVRGTFPYDLDHGHEGPGGKSAEDFWWQQVDETTRFLTPRPGARFAVYRSVQPAAADKVPSVVAAPLQVGQELDLAGVTVGGEKFDLKQLRGKVVLVDFWATWCGPCIAEMPNVKRVHDRYHKDGFEVVGVSLDNSKEAVVKFLKAKEVSWPQLFFEDKDGQGWNNPLARKYDVHAIPFTILVDRAGKVVQLGVRGEALEPAVAKLLGKEPPPPTAEGPAVVADKEQGALQVTQVSLQVDPNNYSGPAPARLLFQGKITANGPGTVRYTFLRSDNSRGPVFTLTFEKAGLKEVSTSWQLSGKHEGWQALKVLAPNEIISAKATFKVECSR